MIWRPTGKLSRRVGDLRPRMTRPLKRPMRVRPTHRDSIRTQVKPSRVELAAFNPMQFLLEPERGPSPLQCGDLAVGSEDRAIPRVSACPTQ